MTMPSPTTTAADGNLRVSRRPMPLFSRDRQCAYTNESEEKKKTTTAITITPSSNQEGATGGAETYTLQSHLPPPF